MERRVLLLCPILLLSFCNAFEGARLDLDVGYGARTTMIGDPAASVPHLLGASKATSTVSSTATVTSLEHASPITTIRANYSLKLDSYSSIKFGTEILLPDTSIFKIYDGQSTTGTVTLKGSKPVVTYTASVLGGLGDYDTLGGGSASSFSDDQAATVGVSAVTAGKRECTVSHKTAYGYSIKYAFGKKSQFAFGFGALRTKDEYKYVVEEAPSGGTANSGVYNASDTTFSENFIIGGTAVTDDTVISNGTAQTNPEHVTTMNYTPSLGVTSVEDQTKNWFGVVGETVAELNDYLAAYTTFGFYYRDFVPSTGATTSAPIVVTTSEGIQWTMAVGFSFRKDYDSF